MFPNPILLLAIAFALYGISRRKKYLDRITEEQEEDNKVAQDVFDSVVEEYEIGDELITIEIGELSHFSNPDSPHAHYHGTLLGIDREKQELHVALFGMGLVDIEDEPRAGKYMVKNTDKNLAHEWAAIPLAEILCNDSLRERQEKPSYKNLVECINV